MTVRQPAVAGMFYPDNPGELHGMIATMLDAASGPDIHPKALIVPHAGYIYSGQVAATAYRLLQPLSKKIHKIVLLGPSHRVPLSGLAAPDCDQFETPLGAIAIDHELVRRVIQLPQVHTLEIAHQWEHSLEVQLPFLQAILSDFTLLPLVVGDASPQEVAEVLDAVWGDDDTLIIISSDLSHYHRYAEANKIDQFTSNKIEHFHTDLQGEQACGCHPLNGLMKVAVQKSLQIATLDLRNSGDTAGDKDRVVGYGAYALYQAH